MPDDPKVINVTKDQFEDSEALLKAADDLDSLSRALDAIERKRRRTQNREDRYHDFKQALRDCEYTDPEKWARANAPYKAKDVQPGSVYQDAALSNVSLMYGNEEYIADDLMPMLQASAQTGIWYTYGQGDRMSQDIDDSLGTRGEANEILETRSTDSFACVSYGLKNFIGQEVIDQQESPLNEFMDATESLAELLAYKKESRGATVLCTNTNYGANTSAIAAADRWNSAGGGQPIANLQTADAAVWSGHGPGDKVAFASLDVYNVLARHPDILDLYKYGGSRIGLATPDLIAQVFGWAGFKVGRAREQTAKEGQTAAYGRVWSDVFGLVRVSRTPSVRNASFGYTVTFPGQVVSEYQPRQGLRGGWVVQATTSYVHKIQAALCGYLFTTPIS